REGLRRERWRRDLGLSRLGQGPVAHHTPRPSSAGQDVDQSEARMRRVTGIGGIFMSAKDPKALCDWYKKHLGIDVQEWGGAAFTWTDSDGNPTKGTTIWSVGPADGDHFAPSKSTFM